MGHKIRPTSYRLGITRDWSSRWFFKKDLPKILEEDTIIRKVINKKISTAGIDKVDIERKGNNCRILIKTLKPGLVISRGGKGIEDLTNAIKSELARLIRKRKEKPFTSSISLNIEEVKRTDISASVVAQQIAWDLEKRMPFRRTMKKYLGGIMQNRDVQGAKIRLAGRLDGAEISRNEWLAKGRLPLTTLRANIDYGEATAFCSYGTVGIKVWIAKGEV